MNRETKMLIALCAITVFILGLSSVASITEVKEEPDLEDVVHVDDMDDETPQEIIPDHVEEVIVPEEDQTPESLTGLLIGLDASGGLTDVMMVGQLNTVNNELKIISVPRDLYIDFREEPFKHIKTNNPNSQVLACKLNEVYSYSGWDDRAMQDVKEIISILTGLEIDYMAIINIEGFEQVVDAVGGVDFYVPQRMYYYDPIADFLIDLYEGQQVLDGNHALQLVRYRKYPMADLQRIQVQQDFLIAMYEEIISDLTLTEALELTAVAYDIVDTDFGLFDALEYAEYLFEIDSGDIMSGENMMTIPSYGEKIDGIWYQFIDFEQKDADLAAFLGQ